MVWMLCCSCGVVKGTGFAYFKWHFLFSTARLTCLDCERHSGLNESSFLQFKHVVFSCLGLATLALVLE